MRPIVALAAICVFWSAYGCAPGMIRPKDLLSRQKWRTDSAAEATHRPNASFGDSNGFEQDVAELTLEQDVQDVAQTDAETDDLIEEQEANSFTDTRSDAAFSEQAVPEQEATNPAAYAEVVASPQPSLDSVTSADDISDPDALTRSVSQVSLDIRPPQGEMPTDLAATAFAASDESDEELALAARPETVVSWTPWTLCYRPLYLEEVALERYGDTVGCIQPGVSAVHFFFGVGLLPYKMVVRPPRSCQCSNGFSRCGDAPPPGYIDDRFHLDAAAIEAALLAGIVIALP
jgi:hypothetical protein